MKTVEHILQCRIIFVIIIKNLMIKCDENVIVDIKKTALKMCGIV